MKVPASCLPIDPKERAAIILSAIRGRLQIVSDNNSIIADDAALIGLSQSDLCKALIYQILSRRDVRA